MGMCAAKEDRITIRPPLESLDTEHPTYPKIHSIMYNKSSFSLSDHPFIQFWIFVGERGCLFVSA